MLGIMDFLNSSSEHEAQPSTVSGGSERKSNEPQASVESQKTKSAILKLKEVSDQRPYYRYNGMWVRQMENASFANILLWWLGIRFNDTGVYLAAEGDLLSYERVAALLHGIRSTHSSNE